MNNCLFIGNGLNRCIASKIAWGDLLKTIAEEYDVKHNNNLSFPLEFECIVNQVIQRKKISTKDVYHEIKQKIVKQIETCMLPEINPHKYFSALKVDTILTTNYDYLIETSRNDLFDKEQIKRANGDKYNMWSFNVVDSIKIFHVHGENKYPKSLCLGYDHYAGTLQNLRARYATERKKQET